MTIENELEKVRKQYNKKWKEYISQKESEIESLPDNIKDFLSELAFVSAEGDNNDLYVTVVSNGKTYRMELNSWSKDCWEIYINGNRQDKILDKRHKQKAKINEILNDFGFKRFRTAYRKPKEEIMLQKLREKHVGKTISDVIDDGEVIRIEFDEKENYYYNNVFDIGYEKENLDKIGEKK